MEKSVIRLVVLLGLPVFMILDNLVDGHSLQESLGYYREVLKSGELV